MPSFFALLVRLLIHILSLLFGNIEIGRTQRRFRFYFQRLYFIRNIFSGLGKSAKPVAHQYQADRTYLK